MTLGCDFKEALEPAGLAAVEDGAAEGLGEQRQPG